MHFNLLRVGLISAGMIAVAATATASQSTTMETEYQQMPSYSGQDLELIANSTSTRWRLW